MSTITINIGTAVAPASSAEVHEIASTPETGDGGSPKFSTAETDSTTQLDIGGPPAWLSEAIGGDKSSGEKQGSENTPSAGPEAEDGGAAKVSLN